MGWGAPCTRRTRRRRSANEDFPLPKCLGSSERGSTRDSAEGGRAPRSTRGSRRGRSPGSTLSGRSALARCTRCSDRHADSRPDRRIAGSWPPAGSCAPWRQRRRAARRSRGSCVRRLAAARPSRHARRRCPRRSGSVRPGPPIAARCSKSRSASRRRSCSASVDARASTCAGPAPRRRDVRQTSPDASADRPSPWPRLSAPRGSIQPPSDADVRDAAPGRKARASWRAPPGLAAEPRPGESSRSCRRVRQRAVTTDLVSR
jgi:hypothetical protein